MSRANRWVALITAGLMWAGGNANAAEQLNTRYTHLSPSDGDLEGDVEQHEFKIGGSAGVLTADEFGFDLDVGAGFQANVWTFDDDIDIDDIDLYKVIVPVSATFDAAETVPVTVKVIPGIHSDFEEVDEDDFRVDALAFGSYQYSDAMKFIFGAGFGEEFGDPEFYPIGGVKWKASEEWQLDLVIPAPRISYALSPDLKLYAAGEPAGGQWNVGGSDDGVDVEQEGYRVGLGAEYQVLDGGWLYAAVGSEGGRTVSVAVDDDEVVDERDVEDATFFQIGFRLN